ncbi:MAG: PorT family protein [Bacteroidales bacterium]|nr:PorT family protein [Bacteroidales bacterium]
MKQVLVITILLFFIGITSVKSQLMIGGKLGGASTNLTGVGMQDFIPDPKVKFIAGAIVNYSFGNRIALQTELLYSGKGSALQYYYEDQVKRGVLKMEQKLGYLSIPIMLQIKMGDRSNYFHFDAGVVSNYLIHEHFTGSIDIVDDKGDVISKDEAFELTQNPANFDLSYAFGIGLVANGLNFDFRYEVGTNKVFQSEEGAPSILNKSFQVSVGYTIRMF